jgi:hypothetical protein
MAAESREKPLQSLSAHHHHSWRVAVRAKLSGFMASMDATVPDGRAPVNARLHATAPDRVQDRVP